MQNIHGRFYTADFFIMAALVSTILAGLLQTKVYYHGIYCLFTSRISKHSVSFDPRVVHLGTDAV